MKGLSSNLPRHNDLKGLKSQADSLHNLKAHLGHPTAKIVAPPR